MQMVSIDGLEDLIIGTGTRDGETEVLVYDGYAAEEAFREIHPNVTIDMYLAFLEAEGEKHRSPIFVYLTDQVAMDVKKQQRSHIH